MFPNKDSLPKTELPPCPIAVILSCIILFFVFSLLCYRQLDSLPFLFFGGSSPRFSCPVAITTCSVFVCKFDPPWGINHYHSKFFFLPMSPSFSSFWPFFLSFYQSRRDPLLYSRHFPVFFFFFPHYGTIYCFPLLFLSHFFTPSDPLPPSHLPP